jgi:hypothetical protein
VLVRDERVYVSIDALVGVGLERVRVDPGRAPVRELVSRKPEVVGRLQVVTGGDAPLDRLAVAEEVERASPRTGDAA